jgi:hypothetical protein
MTYPLYVGFGLVVEDFAWACKHAIPKCTCMVQTDTTEKICLYTGDRPPPIYAAVADIL